MTESISDITIYLSLMRLLVVARNCHVDLKYDYSLHLEHVLSFSCMCEKHIFQSHQSAIATTPQ